MKKTVARLLNLEYGCQVHHFDITAKPHQLLLFGQGQGEPYSHKFDKNEPGIKPLNNTYKMPSL